MLNNFDRIQIALFRFVFHTLFLICPMISFARILLHVCSNENASIVIFNAHETLLE